MGRDLIRGPDMGGDSEAPGWEGIWCSLDWD